MDEVELSGGALKEMHKGIEISNAVLQIGEFNFMEKIICFNYLYLTAKTHHTKCASTQNLQKILKKT